MRIFRLLLLFLALAPFVLVAQEDVSSEASSPGPRVPPPIEPSMRRPVEVNHSNLLPDGTSISLRLAKGIQVKNAQVGDTADFILDHDLWKSDVLVARAGAQVQATVVEASRAKWASRGSKLAIQISSLQLLDGSALPLRGTPTARGGAGPVAQVTGGMALGAVGLSPGLPSGEYCPVCAALIAPIALVSLVAPGQNRNVNAGAIVVAWVDGDILIDTDRLGPLQPPAGSMARVSIVRGRYGSLYERSLYCNGVPLAFLSSGRRLDLELEPGYYRFAINPKKDIYETYLGGGVHAELITDYDRIYAINDPSSPSKLGGLPAVIAPDRSINTVSLKPFAKQKTERQYLQSAKPVAANDVYPTECKPLLVAGPQNSN